MTNRLLITGSGGMLGSAFVKHVNTVDKWSWQGLTTKSNVSPPSTQHTWNLLFNPFNGSLEFEAVVHFAAQSEGSSLEDVNARLLRNTLKSVDETKLRQFINMSAVSVYGRANHDREVNELSAPLGVGSYARSKLLCEQILIEEASCSSISLRLPGVVGFGRPTCFLSSVIRKAMLNQRLCVYNENSKYNNYVFIDDLNQFILCLLDRISNERSRNLLLLGGGDIVTMRELINLVKSITGSSSKIEYVECAGDKSVILDCSRAIELGWSPTPLAEIIEKEADRLNL